jgi:hypothetical protein
LVESGPVREERTAEEAENLLLSLWSEFGPRKQRRPARPAEAARVPEALPVAVPWTEAVPTCVPVAELPQPPRRIGTPSHLRSLTPQERLLCLLGQLSALMDSKDDADWTVNPAYHPEVNAYIENHANNQQFVARARALQRNRAPFYGKTVVAGPRRHTILSLGRTTIVDPPRPFGS